MSTQAILDFIFPVGDNWLKKDNRTPEEKVEEALQKALDNTTPERPGVPWEADEDDRDETGEWL